MDYANKLTEQEFVKLVKTKKDVSRNDLSQINFQDIKKEISLSHIDFSYCYLNQGQDLSEIDFTNSNFYSIDAKGIKFERSIFQKATFSFARLDYSNFNYSDLSDSELNLFFGKKICFNNVNLCGAIFVPQEDNPRYQISEAKFNDDSNIEKNIPNKFFLVHMDRTFWDRCFQAEGNFREFSKKSIVFKYKKKEIKATINYNEEENKFSLIFKNNILLPGGKIWGNCFYYLFGREEKKGIIEFCNMSKQTKTIKIDLEKRIKPIELALTRPIVNKWIPKKKANYELSEF